MTHTDPGEAQRVTLESYNMHIAEYVIKKESLDHKRTAAYWPGIEYFLNQLPPGQTIFEIGSGSGADAQRIEAAGFLVQRSDAAEAFRNLLQTQGHDALAYNVLDQPPPKTYKAILANAVLLHCTTDQFRQAVGNIYHGLAHHGLLCLGMKVGDFEGWREKGLSGERYFKYWQIPALEQELRNAGFDIAHSYVVPDAGFVVTTAAKQ